LQGGLPPAIKTPGAVAAAIVMGRAGAPHNEGHLELAGVAKIGKRKNRLVIGSSRFDRGNQLPPRGERRVPDLSIVNPCLR